MSIEKMNTHLPYTHSPFQQILNTLKPKKNPFKIRTLNPKHLYKMQLPIDLIDSISELTEEEKQTSKQIILKLENATFTRAKLSDFLNLIVYLKNLENFVITRPKSEDSVFSSAKATEKIFFRLHKTLNKRMLKRFSQEVFLWEEHINLLFLHGKTKQCEKAFLLCLKGLDPSKKGYRKICKKYAKFLLFEKLEKKNARSYFRKYLKLSEYKRKALKSFLKAEQKLLNQLREVSKEEAFESQEFIKNLKAEMDNKE